MHVLVVGGGLVGLGSAYAIQQMIRNARVTVWEKESRLGAHQSTHNSGVLHAGLYYTPGSAKASMAVRGIRLMTRFAAVHGVPHDICGKLVVATSEEERRGLARLYDRGIANGLKGLVRLDAARAREIEPHVNAIEAVHVPEEGIIDYAAVVAALRSVIERHGGTIKTNSPLKGAVRAGGSWVLRSGHDEEERADFVVNCAGLQSDRVARLLGARPTTAIVPFRGEYFVLNRPELVQNLIYPVPDPGMPFLGVHYTRMIHGGAECGPNAVLALDREGYRRLAVRPRDALDAIGSPRIWKFIARHPRMTWFELRRTLSRRVFLRSLQRLVPSVQASDLHRGPQGIRAQAMRPDGTLVEDFDFMAQPGALQVLNAPSPAATASLAIGEEIAQRVAQVGGYELCARTISIENT